MNIQSHIHDILSESMKEEDSGSQPGHDITEQQLLQVLRDRGVVDDIMRNLQFERTQQTGAAARAPVMRGEEPKAATHFVDRDSKMTVPLKKGQYNVTQAKKNTLYFLCLFRNLWKINFL